MSETTNTDLEPKKSTPEIAPANPENAEKAKTEAGEKKEESGKKVTEEAKKGLNDLANNLGLGDLGTWLPELFKALEKFFKELKLAGENISKISKAKTPEEVATEITGKIAGISNAAEKTTNIEAPNPKEKLVNYLYRCLKIPVPTAEQLPANTNPDLKYMMIQMMGSFPFEKGPSNIVKGLTEEPRKFFTGDLIFFMDPKQKGTDKEITAGFVHSIVGDTIRITTIDETGTQRIISKPTDTCVTAIHIPGNKLKGPVEEQDKPTDSTI
ncbi:hypothetical protein C0416_05015 [bacterium]|nr:hypothetical protein [bacterium]